MIFSVNKLCSNFNLVNNETKCTLFKAYCTAYYGTETWSMCNVSIEKNLYVQCDKCIRRLLDLPYKTHKYILHIISNIPTVKNQIHLRVTNFYNNKIADSKHNLLNYMYNKFKYNYMSINGRNVSSLHSTYKGSSKDRLPHAIIRYRKVTCIDDICTMNAIHYLNNDAVLDATFTQDEAASFLYYLYCN